MVKAPLDRALWSRKTGQDIIACGSQPHQRQDRNSKGMSAVLGLGTKNVIRRSAPLTNHWCQHMANHDSLLVLYLCILCGIKWLIIMSEL